MPKCRKLLYGSQSITLREQQRAAGSSLAGRRLNRSARSATRDSGRRQDLHERPCTGRFAVHRTCHFGGVAISSGKHPDRSVT
jgi:hypothetical protein